MTETLNSYFLTHHWRMPQAEKETNTSETRESWREKEKIPLTLRRKRGEVHLSQASSPNPTPCSTVSLHLQSTYSKKTITSKHGHRALNRKL